MFAEPTHRGIKLRFIAVQKAIIGSGASRRAVPAPNIRCLYFEKLLFYTTIRFLGKKLERTTIFGSGASRRISHSAFCILHFAL